MELQPRYPHKPIRSLAALARALGTSEERIAFLAENSGSYYVESKRPKRDGTFRQIDAVQYPLKGVQCRILKNVLNEVRFPFYLQGAIRDSNSPRDYINAATYHVGQRTVVCMDISDFYPSVSFSMLSYLWNRFFGFCSSVSEILAKLTSYKGHLPQGAPTSPGLANLVFFDNEPSLVHKLHDQGFVYTRYVDDITISSDRYVVSQSLREPFAAVCGMLASRGFTLKRSKVRIQNDGRSPIKVHGLNVTANSPTLPKYERYKIRSAVYECEQNAQSDRMSNDYCLLWRRTWGRVARVHRLHPSEGQKLIDRLSAVRPL